MFRFLASCASSLLLLAPVAGLAFDDPPPPAFQNVSVHDPSVVRVGETFYVFGSHMGLARSDNLMTWTAMPHPIPNADVHLAEALEWSRTESSNSAHWAPDAIQLEDGRFYFYYCTGNLAAPTGYLGLAVADNIGGPYTNLGLIRRSGEPGFNASIHPNAVDPHTFFDKEDRLWMVYGSYSGGIFILEMNPATGLPLPSQNWGTHLIGGNHSRIEAAYILYSPETDYYYLFVSYGGLGATGGYNIRVSRSRNPAGPYRDSAGTDMRTVRAPQGTFLESADPHIAPHGVKLIGNFRFLHVDGEPRTTSTGYRSPGHNSAYYDAEAGKYFNIFHTRFIGTNQHPEAHQVRVHQMYMNADGWPVMAPHRYAGETLGAFSPEDIVGLYKYINHGKAITADVIESQQVTLRGDGTISGDSVNGTWQLTGANQAEFQIGGSVYKGVFSRQWDHDNRIWVTAFSALSANGVAIWGSKAALPVSSAKINEIPEQVLRYGETLELSIPTENGTDLAFFLIEGPDGMTLAEETGAVRWTPSLPQTGETHRITVRIEGHGQIFEGSFYATVAPIANLRRLDLDFAAPGGDPGILDGAGLSTGFTARLPGTGANRPAHDTHLALDTAAATLAITSTRSDYNGQGGMADNGSVGIPLGLLEFSGGEDFAAVATFKPLPSLANIDQVGLFVGRSGSALTRAGAIVFGTSVERYAVHTENGSDRNGRFNGTGFNGSNGMRVKITRTQGSWRYFIDGVEWNPMSGGQKTDPTYLNGHADLIAGVFTLNPLNDTTKIVELDSFSLFVIEGEYPLSLAEAWRLQHFGISESLDMAADDEDPDGDGINNRLEYALGGNPLSPTVTTRPTITRNSESEKIEITFNRVADPTLVYTVQAAGSIEGPWSTIWSSTGSANTEGPVTVTDVVKTSENARRFLRLVIDP